MGGVGFVENARGPSKQTEIVRCNQTSVVAGSVVANIDCTVACPASYANIGRPVEKFIVHSYKDKKQKRHHTECYLHLVLFERHVDIYSHAYRTLG